MILQRDSRLTGQIQDSGCYFMSILYLANKHAMTEWTIGDIHNVYDTAIDRGFMLPNCFIKDPDEIFALAGLETRYTQHHEAPTRVCADDEVEILRFKHPDWDWYSHFVVGDGFGNVAHDPWGVSVAAGREGSLKDKRIFKLL